MAMPVSMPNSAATALSVTRIIFGGLVMSMVQACVKALRVTMAPSTGVVVVVVTIAMTITIVIFITLAMNPVRPLTIDHYQRKFSLVLVELKKMTSGVQLDAWVIVIIVLLVAWVLRIWKSAVSFVVWTFVIWVYNLQDSESTQSNVSTYTSESLSSSLDVRLDSGVSVGPLEAVTISTSSPLSSSSPYMQSEAQSLTSCIQRLERRIRTLERHVSILEHDKVQQNILIYTFTHTQQEKLAALEAHVTSCEQRTQRALSNVHTLLLGLQHRKRVRAQIAKLYVKQVLLKVLPLWSVAILRLLKRRCESAFSIFQFSRVAH
jgi:hypothetical protein